MVHWLSLSRLSALLAFGVSAALYVQYLDPAATAFCGLDSGCEAVRRSGWGYFQSSFVSFPLLGVLGYLAVFALSLWRPKSRAFVATAVAGAIVAVGLIAVQAAYIHAFCTLCLVVDVAAIAAAVFALLSRGSSKRDPLVPRAWMALLAIAAVAPPLWAAVKPEPPVPEVIRRLYVPGKINVVEFADFQCPHCRALHPALKRAMAPYLERVHFQRLNVPLEMHPLAEEASRAYVCAEKQGKGEAMADRLFAMELSPENMRRAAIGLGLDPKAFDRCVREPETERRIEAETRVLEEAGMQGLPTTYIEGERFLGSVDEAALRDALDRAAEGDSTSEGVPGPLYWSLVAAALVVAAWFGRQARATLPNAEHGS